MVESIRLFFFFFNDTATTEIYTLSLHDALPISLKVTGESMLPLCREGDTIVVSPAARVRKGDRVVVKTRDGEVMAKVLGRRTREAVELTSLNPEHGDRTIPLASVEWMARIAWASQ